VKAYLNFLLLSFFLLTNLILFLIAFILYIKSRKNINIRETLECNIFKSFFDITNCSVFALNDAGIKYVNKSAEELTGYSENELKSMNIIDLVHFSHKSLLEKRLINFKKNDSFSRLELKITKKNGLDKWTEIWGEKIIIKNNPIFFINAIDISEKKEMEEALLDSERKFRKIVETSNEGICLVNSKGSLIFVNEKLAEIIGYDMQEIIGKSLFDFMDKKSKEKAKEKLKDRTNNIKEIYDFKFIKKSGEEVWTIISATPYFDDNKKIFGSIAMVLDITPRKVFETQLKQKELFYQTIMKNFPNGKISILDKNLDFMITYGSESDAQDIAHSNIIRKNISEVFGEEFYDTLKERVTEILDGQIINFEIQVKDVFYKVFALPINYNNQIDILITTQNISDSRKYQEELKLLLSEKEVLIKEIHHRVKNNLAIILSVIGIQYRKCDNDEAKTALEEIRGRIKSISDIHENLYRSDDYVNINIKKYLNDLANYQYKNYISKNKNISLKTDIDDVKITIERCILFGLIINELLTNSLKYAFPFTSSGEIFISFKNQKDEYNLIVKDNGVGYQYDFDIDNVETTGFKIVSLLTNQLNGKILLNTKNGFETKIIFPK